MKLIVKKCANANCGYRGHEMADDLEYCNECGSELKKDKSKLIACIAIAVAAIVVLAVTATIILIRWPSRGDNGNGYFTTTAAEPAEDGWWNIWPTDISIEGPELIGRGENQRLSVSFNAPENLNRREIIAWESSNEAILTVDSDGNVSAHSDGTAVITVSVMGENETPITASIEIQVTIPVASIAIDGPNSLERGQSGRLTATVLPEDAIDRTVTWVSSNSSVATIDDAGNIQALAAGTTEITATAGGQSRTITLTVTVRPPPTTTTRAPTTTRTTTTRPPTTTTRPPTTTTRPPTTTTRPPTTTTTAPPIRVHGVSASPWTLNLQSGSITGAMGQFQVNIYPQNAADRGFRVRSENLSVVNVVSTNQTTGMVTVRGANRGSTRIVITTNDGSFVAHVNVNVR